MSIGAPLGHTVHLVPPTVDDAHPECVEAQISAHCTNDVHELLTGCKHVRLLADGYPLLHHVPHGFGAARVPRTWHRLDEHH